jgi:flagellar biogenesis protein FliO
MKTSMLGLGAIAAIVVAWRVLATVFVVGFLLFKILLIVTMVGFAIWFVRKVLRSESRGETTSV